MDEKGEKIVTSTIVTGSGQEILLEKCLSIYRRKKSLKAVSQFTDRVIADRGEKASFFEDHVIPAVRKEFYPDLTVTSFLDEALEIYRSEKSRTSALIAIWEKIDWMLPFTSDEYEEFVERLEQALANESNPPTQQDWDYLNEWLGK
jgi:hypothetical protein